MKAPRAMQSWREIRGFAASGGSGRKRVQGVQFEPICCSIWCETLNRVIFQVRISAAFLLLPVLYFTHGREAGEGTESEKPSADGGLLPAKSSPCKSSGDGEVPAQPLPADPPTSPPHLLSRQRGCSFSGCQWTGGKSRGMSHLSPELLFTGWGEWSYPHPCSPRGWVSAAAFPAMWVGSQPSRGPSDFRHSGASLLPPHGQGGGVRRWGAHPALLSRSPGWPHLLLLFGSFAGSAVPAAPKEQGVREAAGESEGSGGARAFET